MIVGSMNSSKSHVVIEGKLQQVLVSLDGRALLCTTNSEQFERYPIMRIDRVSVRGNVILSSLALVALTSAGVPLAILDRSASTRAILYPFCVPQRPLAITLMRLSERPEALDIVEDWRCGEASRHARALRLKDPASSARLGWTELEKIILNSANPASMRIASRVFSQIRSFAELIIVKILSDLGCPANWLGLSAISNPNLLCVFSQLSVWRFLRFAVFPLLRPFPLGASRGHKKMMLDTVGLDLLRLAQKSRKPLVRGIENDFLRFNKHILEFLYPDPTGKN